MQAASASSSIRAAIGETNRGKRQRCTGGPPAKVRVRRDPNHRTRSSKPGASRSLRSLAGRVFNDSATEAAEWAPEHELAPGLHLVATPIGNLGDVTLRALWVLRNVDRILCEDTRVTARLLSRFGIDNAARAPITITTPTGCARSSSKHCAAARKLALVSDAGTPLVSDPGFKLVRDALADDLPVTAAPGPSAALTALILSGLPPDAFLFAGFLPPRSAARRRALAPVGEARGDIDVFRRAIAARRLAFRHGRDPRRPQGRGGARADQAARGGPPRPSLCTGGALPRGRPAARRGRDRRRAARAGSAARSRYRRAARPPARRRTACAMRSLSSPPRPVFPAARFTTARSRGSARRRANESCPPRRAVPPSPERLKAERRGRLAELLCRWHLRLRGWRIVASRLALPVRRDRHSGAPPRRARDHRGQVAAGSRHAPPPRSCRGSAAASPAPPPPF